MAIVIYMDFYPLASVFDLCYSIEFVLNTLEKYKQKTKGAKTSCKTACFIAQFRHFCLIIQALLQGVLAPFYILLTVN